MWMWARAPKDDSGVRPGSKESEHWIEGYARVAELAEALPGPSQSQPPESSRRSPIWRYFGARPSEQLIIPIITATAHRQQAPRAVSVGERTQSTRGVAVGCDGVLQMRDQISPEAVRSTL
jgi:hypothetical protein